MAKNPRGVNKRGGRGHGGATPSARAAGAQDPEPSGELGDDEAEALAAALEATATLLALYRNATIDGCAAEIHPGDEHAPHVAFVRASPDPGLMIAGLEDQRVLDALGAGEPPPGETLGVAFVSPEGADEKFVEAMRALGWEHDLLPMIGATDPEGADVDPSPSHMWALANVIAMLDAAGLAGVLAGEEPGASELEGPDGEIVEVAFYVDEEDDDEDDGGDGSDDDDDDDDGAPDPANLPS